MTCRVALGDGTMAFMCSRGRRVEPEKKHYCVACLREGKRTPAFHLCDFRYPPPVLEPDMHDIARVAAETCDKAMCDAHRRAIRPGVDWCRDHEGEAVR